MYTHLVPLLLFSSEPHPLGHPSDEGEDADSQNGYDCVVHLGESHSVVKRELDRRETKELFS